MKPVLRYFLVLPLLAVVLAACGGANAAKPALRLAPESALSDPIRQAPVSVSEAYRFALANEDTLQYIPCYCGCGGEGHRNNYDCYVKEVQPDGQVAWSDHALN